MSITTDLTGRSFFVEYSELPREDPRLGRLVAHDSRSKTYALPVGAQKSAKHMRKVPIFNQGNIGSCTTNAGLGCLGTGIFYELTQAAVLRALSYGYSETSALDLYKRVTKIDEFQGTYPPDDTGSSGNAVGKLFKQLGLIAGWQHALSLEAAITELGERPVITGVPWYSSFDTPDSNGFITRKSGARVKGGHEFVVDGVYIEREFVYCTNSWGKNWGLNGTFKMTFKLWDALLKENGDVTAFVPLADEPTPVDPQPPTPARDVDNDALATAIQKWLKAKGYTTT